MLLLASIFLQFLDFLSAQVESSMGVQSNLDEPSRKEILSQCPGQWQWACRNGECIARYDTCDGIPQCSDGSDEWNCEQWRLKQNQGYNNPGEGARATVTTQAPTTSTSAETGYIILSTKEVFLTVIIFVALALLIVMVIRRRARVKALARNRRGNLLQADSDEDDILISSMYS